MTAKNDDIQNFDFNVGYLVKSPCRDCPMQDKLPDCIDKCEILDKIQTILSESIPSVNNFSCAEDYEIPPQVLEQL